MAALRSVCVFCGSRTGGRAEYAEEARSLGAVLAACRLRLVYGGGSVGLMGIVADSVLTHGGSVLGVIPEGLATPELAHSGVTELRIVESMHVRKAMMAEEADAFIAMPGGLGTLEELLEILTWSQLGLHAKPIGLLNVAGFFDPLIGLIGHARDEGFIAADDRSRFVHAPAARDLLEALRRDET